MLPARARPKDDESKASQLALEKAKTRKPTKATWCDWGTLVPKSAKKAPRSSAPGGGGGGGGGEAQTPALPAPVKFTVLFSPEALPGDTLEIALPAAWGEASAVSAVHVLTYVGGDGDVDRRSKTVCKMAVEVAFGLDGICFALPPPGGLPSPEVRAEAKARAARAAEERAAANAMKGAMIVAGSAPDAASFAQKSFGKFSF